MRDGGRSSRAALQGETLNRPTLLGVERPRVVSGWGKGVVRDVR
jgi:hypothetical protein